MKHLSTYKLFELGAYDIADVNKYVQGMSKSLQDKLFFVDKVDTDLIIDFGCADGVIMSSIQTVSPTLDLIGYDLDDVMIDRAKKNTNNKCLITDNWDEIMHIASDYDQPSILLSSVIHEVYSYSNSKDIKLFWKRMFNPLIKNIIIRDMIPTNDYSKFNNIDINKIREKSDKDMLKDFEDEWGSINNDFRTLLHWLLKYRYKENWERELKENYLPLTIETLKSKIPSDWGIIYEDYYILNFLKQQIKKDFDIILNEPTHLKMIIERK